MISYTIKSGDTLSKLAGTYLGSTAKYMHLAAMNPAITNVNSLRVGLVISIPKTTAEKNLAAARAAKNAAKIALDKAKAPVMTSSGYVFPKATDTKVVLAQAAYNKAVTAEAAAVKALSAETAALKLAAAAAAAAAAKSASTTVVSQISDSVESAAKDVTPFRIPLALPTSTALVAKPQVSANSQSIPSLEESIQALSAQYSSSSLFEKLSANKNIIIAVVLGVVALFYVKSRKSRSVA